MTAPIIEARGVTLKPFPEAPPFALAIQAQDFWLVCGGANSGKSAFIKTLLGLISPASGDVFIDGVSLHAMHPQRMLAARRGISAVLSSAGLIPAWSGFDNLALPVRFQDKLSERKVTSVVEDFAKQCGLPEHWLTQPAARLSRQESALLALARALIIRPRLLIIDNSLVMPLLAQGAGNLGEVLRQRTASGCALVLTVHATGGAERSFFPDSSRHRQINMDHGSVQFVSPASNIKDPA